MKDKRLGAKLWMIAGGVWVIASIVNNTYQYAVLGGLFLILGLDKMRRTSGDDK